MLTEVLPEKISLRYAVEKSKNVIAWKLFSGTLHLRWGLVMILLRWDFPTLQTPIIIRRLRFGGSDKRCHNC